MPEYTQGHAAPVLQGHGKRTLLGTSAALIPYLRPTDRILDIGCGPGSITCDLALAVPQGQVIGVDYSPEALDFGRKLAKERGIQNLVFEEGDVYDLVAKYGEGVFDVVHTNMLLIHLSEPVKALQQMRRVVKEDGVASCREADFETMACYPRPAGPHSSWDILKEVMRSTGAEPNAGRYLTSWAVQAGYKRSEVETSANVEMTTGEEEVRWYGNNHADRILAQGKMVEMKLVTEEERQQMVQGWRDWAEKGKDGAIHMITDVQVLCGGRVVNRNLVE